MNWDKDVLIRAIEAIESIFSRINSKRLLVLICFLLFLLCSKNMTDNAVWAGTGITFLVLMLYMVKASDDKINGQKNRKLQVDEPKS